MKGILFYMADGSEKFWAVSVEGNVCHTFFGRRNTKGQVRTKEFANPRAAESYSMKKYEEKIKKGYETRFNADSEKRLLEDLFRKHKIIVSTEPEPEPDDSETTTFAWAARKAITLVHLNEAVTLVNTVLNTAGLRPCVLLTPEGQVTFSAADGADLNFGYPPRSFIDGLPPVARKALMERNVSRDGWLSVNGTGSGTIEYGESLHQFTVPLFFAVLIRSADDFSVVDLYDNKKNLGVCLDWDRIKIPQGYPKEDLVRAVREHWFTNDTRVRILEDSNTTEYVYW